MSDKPSKTIYSYSEPVKSAAGYSGYFSLGRDADGITRLSVRQNSLDTPPALASIAVPKDQLVSLAVSILEHHIAEQEPIVTIPLKDRDLMNHQYATLLSLNMPNTSMSLAYLNLLDILVCVTHDQDALAKYKDRWLPIVEEELKRRHKILWRGTEPCESSPGT